MALYLASSGTADFKYANKTLTNETVNETVNGGWQLVTKKVETVIESIDCGEVKFTYLPSLHTEAYICISVTHFLSIFS